MKKAQSVCPVKFSLYKYGKEWAIFDPASRCYVLFGTKKEMSKRLKELNA